MTSERPYGQHSEVFGDIRHLAGGPADDPPRHPLSASHAFGSITNAYVVVPRGASAPLGTPHPHPTGQCPFGQLDTLLLRFGYQFVVWVRQCNAPVRPPRMDPVRGGLGTGICAHECTYFHVGWGHMLPQHIKPSLCALISIARRARAHLMRFRPNLHTPGHTFSV